MKHFGKNTKRGFITLIVFIVAVLILIAYFRTDIQEALNYPGVKNALLTAIDWMQNALEWLGVKLGWVSEQIRVD